MQIIGVDPDVEGHALRAQFAKIEVTDGGYGIEDRLQPQIEATGEGLADGMAGRRFTRSSQERASPPPGCNATRSATNASQERALERRPSGFAAVRPPVTAFPTA